MCGCPAELMSQAHLHSIQASHPHPRPAGASARTHDVIVIGGGHAGVEAALAAARLGARVALVSFRSDLLGEMSCNPAIGGLGKGQIAREVDALGGVMGLAIDATGIQFKMLNTAKGAAVRAPRAQADRHRYREFVSAYVRSVEAIELVEGAATGLILEAGAKGQPEVRGALMADGRELRAAAVILTTGTFLHAIMHIGDDKTSGGRIGEASSEGLSGDLRGLGLEIGRLKTGTPPRLEKNSIDWERLEPQLGDEYPIPFSYATDTTGGNFPALPQVACHITFTNPAAHAIIRDNIGRSPMYSGRIDGVGPRYCPAVEDKVMRFADRDRHQIFLEPESLDCNTVYPNGVSTALPAEIQAAFLKEIEGLENVRFLKHGYAVEYDFVQPSALDPSLAVSAVPGLYLAGQINGTSGYEEAAAQGLMAGANAVLWIQDRAPFILARHEAYIGVLIDDLVVSQPTEPYRMFTSRAEYRLLLRQDDADRRLVRRAHGLGLAGSEALARLERRETSIEQLTGLLGATRTPGNEGARLNETLRRPEIKLKAILDATPGMASSEWPLDVLATVEADVKYAGYVTRQIADVERLKRQESTPIPRDLDLSKVQGLREEAREKLQRFAPTTLGSAGRIAGVNPPDVALLSVLVDRHQRQVQSK
jgi:tRNA uridine 5-carboxymethylaminomethyl modification enzyme